MTNTPPNILLLTIDALRADRTSLLGYDRPTTPVLERLAEDGIVCEQGYSLGSFTQTGLVQIMTSSRPLSYGGYDFGAIGRPDTVFKHFHDNGYWTVCLSTQHWVNRFFGYGDGLDKEYHLFGLLSLPGVSLAMIRATLQGYGEGRLGADTLLETADPVLTSFFNNALEYCRLWLLKEKEIQEDFPNAPFVNAGYDMKKVMDILRRHQTDYHGDKLSYIETHLIPAPGYTDWMQRWLPREWYYTRHLWKLAHEAVSRARNAIVKVFNPRLAQSLSQSFKIYPDAGSLVDKVISLLEDWDGKQPFFLWTQFADTHAPYVSGSGRQWHRKTPSYLKDLGHDPSYPPAMTFDGTPKRPVDEPAFSALYDAALRYTDEEIGRLVDALDRLGLRDNTIIVVSGDHGEEFGEHGLWGHFFQLYESGTRVPILIHKPGLGDCRTDRFATALDIAPTIAALAGLPPAEGWEGFDLTSTSGRDYVLMESFYAGNCLFDHRPLYFAVRTADYHYIWREYIDPTDKVSPTPIQLFDLRRDPELQDNIYHADHPEVAVFNTRIAERMAEIPEVSSERIIAAFASTGEAAVARGRKQTAE